MSVALAGAVAVLIVLFLVKARWNYLRLPHVPKQPAKAVDVTVIVPARNEEATIARVVASFPHSRVIVVDDGSTDRTAELARAGGARVVSAPPLRPGWLGKPNACLAGSRHATSDWLLFVDADTWHEPELPASLVRYAEGKELDVVSVFLRQQYGSFFEHAVLPYAMALYFCGVNGRAVNDPRSSEALANGQCLLVRRRVYEGFGGHEAVADSVIEDVALAALAKAHRLRARVVRGEHLGRVRMYDSLASIWRGFEKNSFRFLLVNPWSGVQVILASVLLTSYVPVLLFLLFEQRTIEAVAFALLPSLLLAPWYANPLAALLTPLAIYLFQLIALSAMLATATGRKVLWKGREV